MRVGSIQRDNEAWRALANLFNAMRSFGYDLLGGAEGGRAQLRAALCRAQLRELAEQRHAVLWSALPPDAAAAEEASAWLQMWQWPALVFRSVGCGGSFEEGGSGATTLAQLASVTIWLLRRQPAHVHGHAAGIWLATDALAVAARAALFDTADSTAPTPRPFVLAVEAAALCMAGMMAQLQRLAGGGACASGGRSGVHGGGGGAGGTSGGGGSGGGLSLGGQVEELQASAPQAFAPLLMLLSRAVSTFDTDIGLGLVPGAAESLTRAAEVLLRFAATLLQPQCMQLLRRLEAASAATSNPLPWRGCFWACLTVAERLLFMVGLHLDDAAELPSIASELRATCWVATAAVKTVFALAQLSAAERESLVCESEAGPCPIPRTVLVCVLERALGVGMPRRLAEHPQDATIQRWAGGGRGHYRLHGRLHSRPAVGGKASRPALRGEPLSRGMVAYELHCERALGLLAELRDVAMAPLRRHLDCLVGTVLRGVEAALRLPMPRRDEAAHCNDWCLSVQAAVGLLQERLGPAAYSSRLLELHGGCPGFLAACASVRCPRQPSLQWCAAWICLHAPAERSGWAGR